MTLLQTMLRATAAAGLVSLLAACGGGLDGGLWRPSELPPAVQTKLTQQFARYDSATTLLVERHRDPDTPLKQRLVSRAEWEATLTLSPEAALTPDELDSLRSHQQARIQQSRNAVSGPSRFDFAAWRSLPPVEADRRIREFCATVPKGGMLHVHPWGMMHPETFRALLEQHNPTIPAAALARELANPQGRAWLYADELDWLRSLPPEAPFLALPPADRDRLVGLAALPPGAHPFERFEAVFSLVGLVLDRDWDSVVAAYDAFAARAVRGGVFYVEFTTSVTPETVPRFEALARRLAERYGLTAQFNGAYSRDDSPEDQNAQVLAVLRGLDAPLASGIDLLSNESATPALEHGQAVYGPVLASVRTGGGQWRRTMHAGEMGDPRNPRDALLLGAERLGHGVKLIDDPVTLEYAARRAVPIEVNLSSNLKLGVVPDPGRHPYLSFLRLGLPVSLSTDNDGIFATDIVNECAIAVGQTDVTYDEFRAMATNSLRTSFASAAERERLLAELARRFEAFELR